MPRFFKPVKSSLGGVGPLIEVEQTSELPVGLVVVNSYVDVPSDLVGDRLHTRLQKEMDRAVKSLEKQGFTWDGGPFVYHNPFTGGVRRIAGGFAVARTGIVTEPTARGAVGVVSYTKREVADGVFDYTPKVEERVRYLLAARYRRRGHFYERVVGEDEQPRGIGILRH